MEPSLTDRLCTRCALCCDGSLFADVELAGRAEATRMEVLGLEVEDDDTDGELMVLPCVALQGTRCGVYTHRPKCCRTFECKLLKDVRRGEVGVERALGHIAEAFRRIGRVRELMVDLGRRGGRLPLKESCAETLAQEPSTRPEVNRKRAELESAMAAVEQLIRNTFLGDPATPPARRGKAGRADPPS